MSKPNQKLLSKTILPLPEGELERVGAIFEIGSNYLLPVTDY